MNSPDWSRLSHDLNNAVQALAMTAELTREDPTEARLSALSGSVDMVSSAQRALRDAAREFEQQLAVGDLWIKDGAIQLTQADDGSGALLTVRGKDHDLDACELRAMGLACLAAAGLCTR